MTPSMKSALLTVRAEWLRGWTAYKHLAVVGAIRNPYGPKELWSYMGWSEAQQEHFRQGAIRDARPAWKERFGHIHAHRELLDEGFYAS